MAIVSLAPPTTPPGTLGLPFIGESLEFFTNVYDFTQKRYARYGPVFKTRLNGNPTVVLVGAEAQEYVLASHAQNFLWHEGAKPVYPMFGDGVTFTDGALHDYLRSIMTPAFHGHHLARYLAVMNQVVDQHLATWGDEGTRPFYFDARDIAYALSSSLLIGLDDTVDHVQMKHWFEALLAGAMGIVRRDLPGTAFHRAMVARRNIDATLRRVIIQHRQHPTEDVLGLLMMARDAQGNSLTDDQLIAQAKILLFAGYETTAAAITWMMCELLQQPGLLDRLRDEMAERTPHTPITLADLKYKPMLEAVIKETLRLHLHPVVSMRGVKETFTYGSYTIPAGWMLMLVPIFTQRMADYFVAPERFDPDRFLAPREEDKHHPHAWIAFGGGSRLCLGLGIAQMEMKMVLIKLIERFVLDLVPGQDLSPVYLPNHRITSNLLTNYHQR